MNPRTLRRARRADGVPLLFGELACEAAVGHQGKADQPALVARIAANGGARDLGSHRAALGNDLVDFGQCRGDGAGRVDVVPTHREV